MSWILCFALVGCLRIVRVLTDPDEKLRRIEDCSTRTLDSAILLQTHAYKTTHGQLEAAIDEPRAIPPVFSEDFGPRETIVVHGVAGPPKIDPTVMHQLWNAGMLPDAIRSKACCTLENGPSPSASQKLLSRVTLASELELKFVTPVKIFCGTYTMEANHDTNVKTLKNTWGKRCDGWVAFSTKDDPSIPAINLTHEGEESYDNMWQKSRSIWRYIGAHYAQDFDWFLLGGDDMYYTLENLRYYLGSPEIQAAQAKGGGMFLGRRFFPPGMQVYNSGGAGYLLDRKALGILFDSIDTNPNCWMHENTFREDVNVANCLRQGGGIEPLDTRDASKRERFHPFTPGQHLEYRAPPDGDDWYLQYNPELAYGFECCSDRSISWHYTTAPIMQEVHDFLYHCEQKPSLSA